MLALWLESFLKNTWLAEIVGFLIIFFAIVLLFGLAARVARWLMKEAGLSGFDRFLGAILGLLKGGLMVAVILMGMTAFAPTSKLLAEFATGALLPGSGPGCDLGGSVGVACAFLSGSRPLHQAPQKFAGSPASPPK